MVEETAIRVQINAAKLAGQGIFGILQTVASMLQARQYGQQSIQSLNRQSQALASVELNDKTLPYVRRQLKEYSVDFAITKDKDTGQLNLVQGQGHRTAEPVVQGTGRGPHPDRH